MFIVSYEDIPQGALRDNNNRVTRYSSANTYDHRSVHGYEHGLTGVSTLTSGALFSLK